jgi:hypothetical protein
MAGRRKRAYQNFETWPQWKNVKFCAGTTNKDVPKEYTKADIENGLEGVNHHLIPWKERYVWEMILKCEMRRDGDAEKGIRHE